MMWRHINCHIQGHYHDMKKIYYYLKSFNFLNSWYACGNKVCTVASVMQILFFLYFNFIMIEFWCHLCITNNLTKIKTWEKLTLRSSENWPLAFYSIVKLTVNLTWFYAQWFMIYAQFCPFLQWFTVVHNLASTHEGPEFTIVLKICLCRNALKHRQNIGIDIAHYDLLFILTWLTIILCLYAYYKSNRTLACCSLTTSISFQKNDHDIRNNFKLALL